MERPMNSWNDDRLDELNGRVERCATKEEMNQRFDAVDQQLSGLSKALDGVSSRFDVLNSRFDRLLHTLMAISWGFRGTVLAAAIGLIAVVLL